MMMWDCRSWEGEVLETGCYTLTCKFVAHFQNFSCHITGVFAPNNYIERRIVWDEISAVRGLMEGPWAVCGDFNVTRFISEKKNCRRRTRGMVEFSDFIEDMNLIDLRLEDSSFTWFKGDNQDMASRIDKFLIFEEWDDSFSNIKQIPLQRLTSDHIPVALQGGTWNRNKNYVKFENWWLGTAGFKDKVKEWWSSFNFQEWSRSETRNLGYQRKKLLSQMAELDEVLGDRILTEEETIKKTALFMEYEELIKNEEISWRQKEGDKNTKFFHKVANAHKRFNNIDQLMIHGELTEEPSRIEEEIIDYYQ
uniref:Uncharacterized protein n=1 Tax=Nicotiana tabacum TaxID=4097 RepID=A0A1S4B792_TOBAC|nr:PREDICTED: uncharacterized protein LOC107805183 [Nicotiana tabacum]